MNENIVRSSVTGTEYDTNKVIRILNYKQAALYMAHGARLYDVYPSKNSKTGETCLVYIFDRQDTKPLYELWINYELG